MQTAENEMSSPCGLFRTQKTARGPGSETLCHVSRNRMDTSQFKDKISGLIFPPKRLDEIACTHLTLKGRAEIVFPKNWPGILTFAITDPEEDSNVVEFLSQNLVTSTPPMGRRSKTFDDSPHSTAAAWGEHCIRY